MSDQTETTSETFKLLGEFDGKQWQIYECGMTPGVLDDALPYALRSAARDLALRGTVEPDESVRPASAAVTAMSDDAYAEDGGTMLRLILSDWRNAGATVTITTRGGCSVTGQVMSRSEIATITAVPRG